MDNKVNITIEARKETALLKATKELLSALLPEIQILESRTEVQAGSARADLWLKVKVGGSTKALLFETKSKGEPKYLFNAIGQLSLAMKQFPKAYPIVVVPTLSKEGRATLREAGVGYLTLDGEACLKFDSVLIERLPAQSPFEQMPKTGPRRNIKAVQGLLKENISMRPGRLLKFPFSAKSSRVVRVFLEYPDRAWTIRALTQEAGVALRSALLVVNTLDEKGYIKKDRGAIRLMKRKELLDAWAEEYRFAQVNDLKFFYSLARNFDEFAVKLKELPKNLRENYCLTMFAGSSLVAPQVRFNEIHLFVRGDLNEWVKTLDISPVDSGANAILAIPFDDGVFYARQERKGLFVASNTQLYLDLYNLNDRAREQAETVYKQAMGGKRS